MLRLLLYIACAHLSVINAGVLWSQTTVSTDSLNLLFCCAADNDLYRVMTAGGQSYPRVESPQEAIAKAESGWGVLLLADGYPEKTTPLDQAVFDGASTKGLRLYVEYPSSLPGTKVGAPRKTHLERAVVASDVFGASLPQLRLLALHDCHLVEIEAEKAHLVAARVAGFDTAVFGLDDVKAILSCMAVSVAPR
jgi:hypothetical protein